MRIRVGNLALIILTSAVACASDKVSGPVGALGSLPRPITESERALINGSTKFAFRAFQQAVAAESGQANVAMSPLSLSMALTMAYNGAAGATEAGFRTALNADGLSRLALDSAYGSMIALLTDVDHGVELRVANSVWYDVRTSLHPDFVTVNQDFLHAQVNALDFSLASAGTTINDWVRERTAGHIPALVDQLPQNTVVYLANALYFHAGWTTRFDPSFTTTGFFHPTSAESVAVSMMHGTMELRAYRSPSAQIIELPYSRAAYTMTILLPEQAVNIESFVAALSDSAWNDWVNRLGVDKIALALPRFAISYGVVDAPRVLRAIGLKPAFCDETPDFSRMSDASLCISDVRHRVTVQVDENGTEASAATGIGLSDSAPLSLSLDRPFVFMIRERFSGAIVMIGLVRNPSAGQN